MIAALSEEIEALRDAKQRFAALTNLSLELASEHDTRLLLDKVCRGACHVMGAQYGVLAIDGGDGQTTFCAAGIEQAKLRALSATEEPLSLACADGLAHRYSNPTGDPVVLGLPSGFPRIYHCLIAPVTSPTQTYGWIFLAGKLSAVAFSEDDLHILATLAAQAGHFFEHCLLHAEVQLSQQVLEQSRECVLVSDAQNRIVMVNKAFTDVTGYTQAEVLGREASFLNSDQNGDATCLSLAQEVCAMDAWQGELWNRRKDGTEYPAWQSIRVMRNDEGYVCNHVYISNDISEQKAAQERIGWLSHFDPLTGLPNRALLADRCSHDLSSAMRDGKPLAMMVLGVDQFKLLNDTMGHTVGDHVLKQFAHRLTGAVREQDTVARVSGGEFVVVLPGSTAEGASLLASRLLNIVAEPFHVHELELSITASIGIATYPSDGKVFETLFKSAEVAMHQAKGLGTNRHQFFDAERFEGTKAQVALASALRTAIARHQLALHYQPFGDLQTGRIGGMEALLRWTHPELGTIPPNRFIPVAEHSGLIKEIGAWVLRQACRDIHNWRSNGISVPPVSVNISPVQFRDASLPQFIEEVLQEYGIEPGMLCLEVTEGVLMEDVHRAERTLHALRALGLKLSLDDFGTGYSSLSYLKAFPFDKVKIDQSFVRDVLTSESDAVIAKVIISLAHGLGLRVIAEGVETEIQCDFMRGNICDEIQGYFFSRPVPMAEMGALLVTDRRLPDHLLRAKERPRTVLLVDDDPKVLAALKGLLLSKGYRILTACSGTEGLALLSANPVDIVVSDQCMPGMTGVEFLHQSKDLYPGTMRIVLSAYTELKAVTDAINEGVVYRFLIKPWDDNQFCAFIEDAFHHKDLADKNEQLNLEIKAANQELAFSNRQLQEVLSTREQLGASGEQRRV